MSLSKILNQFNKTLLSLDKLVKQNNSFISSNNKEINRLHADNTTLITEREKAAVVANNLRQLIGEAKK